MLVVVVDLFAHDHLRTARALRAAFVSTEQAALAAALALTESARRGMLAGPWRSLVRVGFVPRRVAPRMRLARAADDGLDTPFRDVVAIHAAALYLETSIDPWVP